LSVDAVRELMQRALLLTSEVAAPFLIGILIIGLLVGVLQAATQVQEAALGFIPKLVVVAVLIVVAGPWTLDRMVSFTRETIASLADMTHHGEGP
jgi:flagellar biosynthetic protein FliQ